MPRAVPCVGTTAVGSMNDRMKTTVPSSTKPVICLKVSIQAPGFGRKRSSSGNTPINRYGTGHAEAERAEHDQRRGHRLRDGPGDGAGHERAGAGRGEHGGDRAFDERAERPFLARRRLGSRRCRRSRGSEFPTRPSRLSAIANTTAASVTLNAGAAELAAPRETDRRREEAQQQEHRDDAGRIPEIEHQRVSPAVSGLLDEAHHLEPDHRQHAGHQLRMMPPTNASTM